MHTNPTAEALAHVRAYQRSKVLEAFDRRQALAKSDPLLAFVYWCEAAADRRIETDVNALALLTDMRNRALEAIGRATGIRDNLLFPERS